jgi:AraC-like DNA-binding protein
MRGWEPRAPDCTIHAAQLLHRRIAVFESNLIPEYRGRLARWQARRVLAYVETNLDARLKVSEIAGAVHLSASHFSRAFKRTFGMTVHAWVMRRRIETAQGMMLNTPDTLSEIALRCGLSDQSHLTRWFRRVVGETPGSWRRDRYEPSMQVGRPAGVVSAPGAVTMLAMHSAG